MEPVVAMGDYRSTDLAEEVQRDLTERIEAQLARFEQVVAEEVPAFNRAAQEAELGALVAG